MASIDRDSIGSMLHGLEHLLDTVDRTSIFAGQVVNAQKTGKPLSPATLKHSSARRILRSSLVGPLVSDPVRTFAFFSRRR